MKETVSANKISPFGLWLYDKRTAKGWSMRELSDRTDNVCSAGYIGQIENGNYTGKKGKPMQPSEEIVEKIAFALGESINEARRLADYPVLDETEEERIQNEFSQTIHKYGQLSPISRKFANRHFSETIKFLLDVEQGQADSGELPLLSDYSQAIELQELLNEDIEDEVTVDEDFDRRYDQHLENVRQGKVEQPPFIAEQPTQEEIDRQPKMRLPKKKNSPLKKREGS